jgi:hypothetical protein
MSAADRGPAIAAADRGPPVAAPDRPPIAGPMTAARR